jgi:hypothetical protein
MEWFFTLQPPTQAAVISAIVSGVVAIAVAILNPFMQREIERLKGQIGGATERLKAQLASEDAAKKARLEYEFDARKRLYSELEPLLFQLFEAAEHSYFRVVSLVRTQRLGNLGISERSWLVGFRYYFCSTIFRLFLPLAIFRIIQRSATFVDLGLDEQIRTKYFLLKLSYLAFTDDFVIARQSPPLKYDPNNKNWEEERKLAPEVYWRQGLYLGHIDRLIEIMIVQEEGKQRPITYGEFEDKAHNDPVFKAVLEPILDVFHGFSFETRPILARILLTHACLMRLLLYCFNRHASVHNLIQGLRDFLKSDETKNDIIWSEQKVDDYSEPVRLYLEKNVTGHSVYDYAIK